MSIWAWLFTISAAFVVYVLAGYPLALAVAARIWGRGIRKNFVPAPLTIIVPVRNGAKWIRGKLESLLGSDYPGELIEVMVVSDGSTDETNSWVEQFPDRRVRLLALAPGGKATAVSRGLEESTTDLIVLTDVRQIFDPPALRHLVACFAEPSVGVVTGELVIREGLTTEEFNTGLYWKYEKWIRRNLNRVDAMLGATGSIYAIRREAIAAIPADILLDDVYLPFVAVERGYRIFFEEQAKAYDLPTSLQSEFRRKVRTQAGIYQIIGRFPWLLSPGNKRFVHFFSHKFGRLLLPFAMIAACVSSFGLPHPFRYPAIAAQALFYLAALADPVIPEKTAPKRLSAVIRAFVVLVTAALCAVAVFLVPAQKLWKETQVRSARETGAPQQ